MLNNIYEERQRQEDHYHLSLSIPRNEYISIYGEKVTQQDAQDVVEQYLIRKEDDGDPYNVNVFDYPEGNIVNIEVDLNYLGNEQKDYN